MRHMRCDLRGSPSRSGVVLLAVLVVIVLLELAALQYVDLMTSEYKASDNYHKTAQARAFADSGIHYAMAILSSPDNLIGLLNDNPYDNAQNFNNRPVTLGGDKAGQGYFTLIAPLDPSDSGSTGVCRFGVIDEASKININAIMKSDPTGDTLYKMLLLLPNMTDEIANSIVDWVDTDSTPRQGGAENDYYSGLSPSYQCKNGPLDSIEELLLVKGVTPQLLFGSDLNCNGYQEPDETNNSTTTTGFDRGWAAYLTIYSREQNLDATGLALTNLNDSSIDLATMYDTLSTKVGDDLAKFIIMYRQFGPDSSSSNQSNNPQTQSSANTAMAMPMPKGGSSAKTQPGVLSNYTLDPNKKASKKISSIYDLVNAQVSVASNDPKKPPSVYKSPLSDAAARADLLPKLFQAGTIFAAAEIPARININTAPQEVVAALPGLSAADVQAIMGGRPQYSSGDSPGEAYQTPAWLVTQANVDPAKLSKLEKMITTRTQVYRVQSLGYFDAAKGPLVRIEAVIDTNGGQPRILSWRDMGDFGRVRPPQ